MDILLLIIGIILLAASLVFLIYQKLPACVFAYLALCALHFSTAICLPVSTFVFWGVATVIMLIIGRLSPKGEPDGSIMGNVYVTAGAIAGLMTGMSVDASIMILCTIVGAFFGQLAYSRTHKGCWLRFPSSSFISYFCAKGFKAIVTVAMVGISIEGFVRNLGR